MKRSLIPVLMSAAAAILVTGCPDDPPPAEPDVLSRQLEIAPGAVCAQGGTEVVSGRDRDLDGALGDDEIEESTTVCRSDDPAPLVRVDDEPVGDHCARGGSAIRTGADRNRNGSLDDDEIASTTYVCDPSAIYEGSFTAEEWSDPTAVARLARAQVVTGDLELGAAASLPQLAIVGGNLRYGAGDAGAIALPALAEVGGGVFMYQSAGAASWPALIRIGGDVYIDTLGLEVLEHLSAPRLTRIAGSFVISSVRQLEAPALSEIGGALSIGRTGFVDVPLPALTRVGGPLFIAYNEALTRVDGLAALQRVDGDVRIIDNPVLADVVLPALAEIGSVGAPAGLTVAGAPVRSVRLPTTLSIYGLVELGGPALEELDVSGLGYAGAIAITDAPLLTRVDLSALRTLGDLSTTWDGNRDRPTGLLLRNTHVQDLLLPELATSRGYLLFDRDPALNAIRLPSLLEVRGLSVMWTCTSVAAIAAPRLSGPVESLILRAPVTELDLSALRTVSDTLRIQLTRLGALALPHLESVGTLELLDNASLVDARLGSLSSLRSLVILDNRALVGLAGTERITRLDGDLTVRNSGVVSLVGLAGLVTIGGAFDLSDNPGLTSLDGLARLVNVDGRFVLDDDPGLTTLAGLARLARVGGSVELVRDGNLPAEEIAAFVARVKP